METILSNDTTMTSGSKSVLIGRIISGICILFLLFDAIAKIFNEAHAVQGSVALGIPENTISGIGMTLLVCTIIYIIPRTAILGAILLTGYLGGAMAIMVRANQQFLFALVFGILVWVGLYLRDEKVKTLLFK
jgi:hypothetical protein